MGAAGVLAVELWSQWWRVRCLFWGLSSAVVEVSVGAVAGASVARLALIALGGRGLRFRGGERSVVVHGGERSRCLRERGERGTNGVGNALEGVRTEVAVAAVELVCVGC